MKFRLRPPASDMCARADLCAGCRILGADLPQVRRKKVRLCSAVTIASAAPEVQAWLTRPADETGHAQQMRLGMRRGTVMTLMTFLGVWFVLQVIVVWWLGSTARALHNKPRAEPQTAPQHNFAS